MVDGSMPMWSVDMASLSKERMRRECVGCVRQGLHVDGQSTCILLVTVQRWVNPMKQGIPREDGG